MLGATLLTDGVIIAFISTSGVVLAAFFTYLGVKTQVKKVGTSVDELTKLNTSQHGFNAGILNKMLDTIAEQGIMVSTMVNVQDHPIFKTDAGGALIQVNAAGVRLLGMAAHELTGDGWVKAVHPDDRLKVFSTWEDCVRDKRPFGPISYRYVHPTSRAVTLVEAVATPVVSLDDGELLSWVAVVVPITKLEEAPCG